MVFGTGMTLAELDPNTTMNYYRYK